MLYFLGFLILFIVCTCPIWTQMIEETNWWQHRKEIAEEKHKIKLFLLKEESKYIDSAKTNNQHDNKSSVDYGRYLKGEISLEEYSNL